MATEGDKELNLSGLKFSYGNRIVLRDISLKVKAGEAAVLFGRNGSGKSTLLKLISGVLRPDSGSIYYAGFALHMMKVHQLARLGIGYLMQGGVVFPSLTVGENLALAQSQRRNAKRQDSLPDVFGTYPFLSQLMSQRAGLLSGGERQALAISMILSQGPQILLLDEPVASLSSDLSMATVRLINGLCHESKCLAVIAEHNFTLAKSLSATCYRLNSKNGDGSTITPMSQYSTGGSQQ